MNSPDALDRLAREIEKLRTISNAWVGINDDLHRVAVGDQVTAVLATWDDFWDDPMGAIIDPDPAWSEKSFQLDQMRGPIFSYTAPPASCAPRPSIFDWRWKYNLDFPTLVFLGIASIFAGIIVAVVISISRN